MCLFVLPMTCRDKEVKRKVLNPIEKYTFLLAQPVWKGHEAMRQWDGYEANEQWSYELRLQQLSPILLNILCDYNFCTSGESCMPHPIHFSSTYYVTTTMFLPITQHTEEQEYTGATRYTSQHNHQPDKRVTMETTYNNTHRDEWMHGKSWESWI